MATQKKKESRYLEYVPSTGDRSEGDTRVVTIDDDVAKVWNDYAQERKDKLNKLFKEKNN